LNLCYFGKFFFHFREKYHISRNFFGISGKSFSYLGKNVIYPVNVSGKKFLDALFFPKSAPQSLPPPQLLEASYTPA
jgi:hypothetical protein